MSLSLVIITLEICTLGDIIDLLACMTDVRRKWFMLSNVGAESLTAVFRIGEQRTALKLKRYTDLLKNQKNIRI